MLTIRNLTPNLLSLSRIPASAVFLWFYSDTEVVGFWLAIAVAVFALATDFADGYLARRWNVTSETGYFLDGLGDKCFTVSICFVVARLNPDLSLLMWALVTRELVLYALRSIDRDRLNNLTKLRHLSLWQAGFIRLFFLIFFVVSAANVYGYTLPNLFFRVLAIFGYASAVFGWATVFFISKGLIRQSTEKQ